MTDARFHQRLKGKSNQSKQVIKKTLCKVDYPSPTMTHLIAPLKDINNSVLVLQIVEIRADRLRLRSAYCLRAD